MIAWDQPRSGAERATAAVDSGSRRKIIQTPSRTNPAPNNDQIESLSPPKAHPITIAPGGVMSEMVCRFVTDIRGISQ